MLDTVLAFLVGVTTSFFFWPVLIVSFLWLAAAVGTGRWFQTFFSTVVVIGAVALKWPEVGTFIKEHLFASIGIYLLAGLSWSLAKWVIKVNSTTNQVRDISQEYVRTNKLATDYFKGSNVDPDHIQGLAHALSQIHDAVITRQTEVRSIEDLLRRVTPQASRNKADLFAWGLYWPASIVWFVLSDALKAIGEFLYARFGRMFQSIADRMMKKAI